MFRGNDKGRCPPQRTRPSRKQRLCREAYFTTVIRSAAGTASGAEADEFAAR